MQDRHRQLGKIHLRRTAGPYIWVNRDKSLRAENRSCPLFPEERRKGRTLASVARGHGGGRREPLQRPDMMVTRCYRQSAGPRLRLRAAFRR